MYSASQGVLVSQQNALRGKDTSKVFTTEFREGVAMPTASEELIALAESAMDGVEGGVRSVEPTITSAPQVSVAARSRRNLCQG